MCFWRLLPEPLFDAPLSYVLEARDGTLLSARIAADGQWRFPPREEVPAKFRRALILFEDKRFENHAGVDLLAIARAVKLNTQRGRVVSGGSTLTMQIARMARRAGGAASERTVGAKAMRGVARAAAGDGVRQGRVLALYAGHAPFGGNVVGLEAAAWRYFGREPRVAVVGGGRDARGAA